MKTLLKPYVINFLKTRGYRYFLLRKISEQGPASRQKNILVPVIQKPMLSRPFIGYDRCFPITESGNAEYENMNPAHVLLTPSDLLQLKIYLLWISDKK